MILAVDVHYSENKAIAAGVLFEGWQAEAAQVECVSLIEGVAGYEPGKFYKRELPCILQLIADHRLKPECILIDGFVFLDGFTKPGLGKVLYDALKGEIPVIGVAKTPYKDIDSQFEVVRGASQKPLYVTAVGLDLEQAKRNIRLMHGENRLPTLIKRADQICRSIRAA